MSHSDEIVVLEGVVRRRVADVFRRSLRGDQKAEQMVRAARHLLSDAARTRTKMSELAAQPTGGVIKELLATAMEEQEMDLLTAQQVLAVIDQEIQAFDAEINMESRETNAAACGARSGLPQTDRLMLTGATEYGPCSLLVYNERKYRSI